MFLRYRHMEIGLLGYGTVGKSFYELASESDNIQVKTLLSRRPRPELSCRITPDIDDIINDDEIDTVVEVIGGIHPAYEYISAALKAGKNVVSANKAVICAYYDEFLKLALENGVKLRYTAAAGGGIPWLESLSRISRQDNVSGFEGILNGTTNFILSNMTDNGADYSECLKEAQRIGFAEADPTADVEGYDARRKVVISANIAFGVSVCEDEVPCIGITKITAADIAAFSKAGLTVKLIGHAHRNDGSVSACVEPMLFPEKAAPANIRDGYNIITLYADRVKTQSFTGLGAGGYPTGANVLADCISIDNGCGQVYTRKCEPVHIDNSAYLQCYYIRSKTLPGDIPVSKLLGAGIVTSPISIKYAHNLYKQICIADPQAAMAAVKE